MNHIQTQVEIEIGIITYSMLVEISYYEGKNTGDPTTDQDHKFYSGNIYGKVTAWNSETDNYYNVTEKEELEMIENWVDFEEILEDELL